MAKTGPFVGDGGSVTEGDLQFPRTSPRVYPEDLGMKPPERPFKLRCWWVDMMFGYRKSRIMAWKMTMRAKRRCLMPGPSVVCLA